MTPDDTSAPPPGSSVERWLTPRNQTDMLAAMAEFGATSIRQAEFLLEAAAPRAALAIVNMVDDPLCREDVRLRAAQYVLDNTAGRSIPKLPKLRAGDRENPVENVLNAVLVDADDRGDVYQAEATEHGPADDDNEPPTVAGYFRADPEEW